MQHFAALINNAQPMVRPSAEHAASGRHKTSSDLLARVRAMEEEALHRQQANAASDQQTPTQLPFWPDVARGVPNSLLRTALFTICKDHQKTKTRTLLASTADVELRFSGDRLNQNDLDVWEMLLHLARWQPLGDEVRFRAYSLLKGLGRGTGKTQREQLKNEIARLQGGVVEIAWKKDRKTFSGQLVGNAYRDEVTQHYVVILNENLLRLYDDGHTHINWAQRQALSSSLAKWLHGFYASHAKAYPYKVETLRGLCGSATKQLRNFRQMLKVALDELVGVGAIKRWEITATDLAHVVVVPSDSQVKHVNKNKKHVKHKRIPSTFFTLGPKG